MCCRRANYARSRLQKLVGKARKGFFDSPKCGRDFPCRIDLRQYKCALRVAHRISSGYSIPDLFPALSVVELGKAALAGFPEALVQIDAGFVHSPADHVVADVPVK